VSRTIVTRRLLAALLLRRLAQSIDERAGYVIVDVNFAHVALQSVPGAEADAIKVLTGAGTAEWCRTRADELDPRPTPSELAESLFPPNAKRRPLAWDWDAAEQAIVAERKRVEGGAS
jgi:hypothetical protein